MNTIKGFKASYEGKCRNQSFRVGQTYTIIEGELEMCENGFHFCQTARNVLTYYPQRKDFRLFEVEALGDIKSESNKSVTNKLKIVRIIPESEYLDNNIPVMTFDEKGRELTYKDSGGYSYEYTRDKNGNVLTYKHSSGYSYEYIRDKNGQMLAYKETKVNPLT